jgi:hypothetical protein
MATETRESGTEIEAQDGETTTEGPDETETSSTTAVVVEEDHLVAVVVMTGNDEMTTTSLPSKQELPAKLVDEALLPRSANLRPT